MSEEIVQPVNDSWPDAVERFGLAVYDFAKAWATERRKKDLRPDRLGEFISKVMTDSPLVFAQIAVRALASGFGRTETSGYLARGTAEKIILKEGRPATYRLPAPAGIRKGA